MRSLLRRMRWDVSDASAVNSRDPATMARIFAYLFAAGGTLVLLTLALPHGGERWLPGLILPPICALVVAGAITIGFTRIPQWVYIALPPLGAVLVSVVIYSSGAATITAYAGLYFWVAVAAFSFFGMRVALLNLIWVGLLYAAVLIATPEATQAVLRWTMVLGTLTVAALVIAALRGRVEHLVETLRRRTLKQEKVAELGERAVAGAAVAELATLASRAVTEALQVERAGVLRLLPDDRALLLTAGDGWPPELIGTATVSRDDPVVLQALDSSEGDGAQDAAGAIGAAIPGRPEPFGVLAAFSGEPRSFTSVERSFLQSLGHVLGDAVVQRQTEQEAKHAALHDHLTGRPNRALFTDRLQDALARSRESGTPVGVFFLDVDDLKLINDGFGHGAGDELLKAIGPRLRQALVMSDILARFGGDEFAILCEDVDGVDDASEIAGRLIDALAEPFEVGGADHRISASIGVTLSSSSSGPEELIAEADAAMYLAKERSRGGFEFFDQELRQKVLMRLRFEGALRAAPESDQLSLAIEPIVSLPDGVPVASEALLRWRHPDLGSVSAADFIPIAEETGAIIPIGAWVLREAFQLAARWRTDPVLRRYLPIYVNLSVRQLAQPGFAAEVESMVKEAGARIRDLGFEITEHALMAKSDDTVETLAWLQSLGFAISLDDFGTGFSSLSHLKRFPLDIVKVDRLFVANLLSERRDEAIVSAVVGMADAFALDVVAEGIETSAQARRLAELGCRFGQGYHFAKPALASELEQTPRLGTAPEAAQRDPESSAARASSMDP